MMLQQLLQLPESQVGGQSAAAAVPHHGPLQPQAHLHRLRLQGLLRQHPKGTLRGILHAGQDLALH